MADPANPGNFENADAEKKLISKKKSRHLTIVLFLVCSVITNVLLARKVELLKDAIMQLKSEGRLQLGSQLPPFEARTLEGIAQVVDFKSTKIPTVLYVFTPQCGWCKKNLENLRVLIDKSGARYKIIGVSLTREDLKEYMEREHLAFPVYTDLTDATKSIYRLGGTPETIVVSTEGKVLKVWLGAYTNDLREEIQGYLGLQLPGCCAEPTPAT